MRIGIDASRAFVNEPTGTERYSYELITRILRLEEARAKEWVLYVKSGSKVPLSLILPPNFSPMARGFAVGGRQKGVLKNIRVVEIPFPLLWTQAGLAYRTWVDRLDVLWVPAHTLPLLRRGFGGLGRPLITVVTIHGIEYEWLPAYENWLQRWYLPLSTKYAVHSATKIIAVSEFTKKQLIDRLGAEERRIKVIYEGFSTSKINYQGEVLKKFGLIPHQYLLFVGTIQPRKNLVRLVEAFAKIYTPLWGIKGKLKLVICGKFGWSYDEVLAAPKKYGVENSVIFTGYVNDTVRSILLQYALVYVQPSVTEGFGLPVLEAMASGVPVVSSKGGALAEVVGSAGLLFDPASVLEISECLIKVIKDEGLRRQLVRRGEERITDFSWEKAADETYKLLTAEANISGD